MVPGANSNVYVELNLGCQEKKDVRICSKNKRHSAAKATAVKGSELVFMYHGLIMSSDERIAALLTDSCLILSCEALLHNVLLCCFNNPKSCSCVIIALY